MSESEIEELQRIRAGWVTKRNAYLQAQMLGIGSTKENEEGVMIADKYIADIDKRISDIRSKAFYTTSLVESHLSNILSRKSPISLLSAQTIRTSLPLVLFIVSLIIFIIVMLIIRFAH